MKTTCFLLGFFPVFLFSQTKAGNVSGELIQADGSKFSVGVISRSQLQITGCSNPHVDTLLRTLLLTRISRKYLRHLITSASEIRLNVSDKIGIMLRDGKYRLIAGITGPENDELTPLIPEVSNLRLISKRKNKVFSKNTIELFRGSIFYFQDSTMKLDSTNVALFDFERNELITDFSMDTIPIEPIMYPDKMYQNMTELYYFAGIHEIRHTTPSNIFLQRVKKDPEEDAFLLERKLFRKRKQIQKKGVKYPG